MAAVKRKLLLHNELRKTPSQMGYLRSRQEHKTPRLSHSVEVAPCLAPLRAQGPPRLARSVTQSWLNSVPRLRGVPKGWRRNKPRALIGRKSSNQTRQGASWFTITFASSSVGLETVLEGQGSMANFLRRPLRDPSPQTRICQKKLDNNLKAASRVLTEKFRHIFTLNIL